MSRKQLTSKQHAFLEFLAEHVRRQKVWPTYRQMVDHFGYRSPNSVTQNLQALAKKGYLTRDGSGYRLLGQRKGLPGGSFSVQGTIAEGAFETALSIEEVTLRDLFPALGGTFAVRVEQGVRGVDVGAGEHVLLHDRELQNGDMALVLHEGEAALCRVLLTNGTLHLQHTDGEEVYVREETEDLRLLGPYAGHINRHGLRLVPSAEPAVAQNGAHNGAVSFA